MITTSWREENAERVILGPGSAKRRQTKLSSLHKIVIIRNTKHESVAVNANMMRETMMTMMMNETNSESELALDGCGGVGGDEPFRDDNRLTPRARKKIKMKQEKLTEPKSIQLIPAHSNKSTRVMQTTNYVRKPPEPQGAFLNPYTSTRLLLLALCMLVAEAYITSATASFITSDHSNRLDTEHRTGSTDLRHRDHGLANGLSATYRHLADRQQRKHQQKLQQDQLRYLIARTSLPQLIGRRHYGQPTSQIYKHRHTNHRDNNIIDYNKESSHPNPVQHTSSQQRSRTKERRNPFFDNIHAGVERDLERFSVGYVDPLIDDDVDSLDVELADSEDTDDIVVDDDVRDNDYDQDDDDEDDDVAEDDEEEADEKMDKMEDENYVPLSNGDKASSIDDQNSILMDEPVLNKDYAKESSLKRLRLLSKTTKNHQPQFANYYSASKYLRTSKEDKHSNQSSNQSFIETLTRRPYKGRQHHNEVGPESHEMVTTSIPVHLDDLSRREQLHLRTQKSLPSAPYQSPVVVSISDNSFVSASPVNLEFHSVNGVDDVESPARPEGEATVHYSHIIAGPKNELPSYGRRYWHDSHMASIHMVQEEPNELHRGDINSAIIAILFGIGVTGMLIMIVSIKMRSIRERVAYKGRRRSLVPDTDFLINTIPM